MFKKVLSYTAFSVCILFATASFAEVRHFSLPGDHGMLQGIFQYPDTSDYPAAILMHGFHAGKDMGLMKVIADKLEQKGVASIRFDFNGHGGSEGRFEDMTIPNEIEDARKIYEYVKNQPQITSISLAGHSQGGLIASMLAGELGEENIKSLVLLAASPNIHDMVVQGNLFGIKFDLDNLPEYIDIPWCCKVGKKYLETARDLKVYDVAFKYKGPVLLVHGYKDDVVPYSYSVYYHDNYADSDVLKFEGIENSDHLYSGYEQEVSEGVADFVADKVFEKSETIN